MCLFHFSGFFSTDINKFRGMLLEFRKINDCTYGLHAFHSKRETCRANKERLNGLFKAVLTQPFLLFPHSSLRTTSFPFMAAKCLHRVKVFSFWMLQRAYDPIEMGSAFCGSKLIKIKRPVL